jgi:hypothetical protein
MITKEDDILDEVLIHPTTAKVFVYLKSKKTPVGVREVQRVLNLGSSSTAYWHLNKLRDNGVAEKLGDNSYKLASPYQDVKKIRKAVTVDHYFIGKNLIPEIVVQVVFLVILTPLIILLMVLGLWVQAALTGCIGLATMCYMAIKFYIKVSR